jgi:hypothetical protein
MHTCIHTCTCILVCSEARERESALEASIRKHEHVSKQLRDEVGSLETQKLELQRKVDTLSSYGRDMEKKMQETHWDMEDKQRSAHLRTRELEQELRALNIAKQDIIQVIMLPLLQVNEQVHSQQYLRIVRSCQPYSIGDK